MDMTITTASVAQEVIECYVISLFLSAFLIAIKQTFRDKLLLLHLGP